ncbi:DNA (cytosine-5)-methyltransferase 1 [Streptomyces sp. V4I23]|uniref:DNA cytosine methyltransferase n=1 Tax=Streptomyces sp. V4I23 TaxID=3042282 RepID=UPI0027836343|nr:DNA cytosine methyltransferase [Streptomyces sp. V4I23]MDQ1010578.1 DNA (cytosine-5)-methyltransferase 1 [Streptomyces sp. V4I23]
MKDRAGGGPVGAPATPHAHGPSTTVDFAEPVPRRVFALQPREHVSEINIVDLFAGPGGLDIAAVKLGLSVTGIEKDANACATRAANGLITWQGDVRGYAPREFSGGTRVLTGGPPCQTYTVAGSGVGRHALDDVLRCVDLMAAGKQLSSSELDELGDERTGLVLEPLKWVLQALKDGDPYTAIVLEQVPAVLPVWQAYREVLADIGYEVKCGVLRAEQYGVPQTRRRAILVARLHGKVELPAPTHRSYRKGVPRNEGDPGLKPWVSMSDVLTERDTPYVVVSNYGSGGDPKARGRRRHDQPAATVTGKVSRNRVVGPGGREGRFTNEEAGMLQTFPADFKWSGSDVAQQIGNAIPPVLAAHVLSAALELGRERLADAVKSLSGGTITV